MPQIDRRKFLIGVSTAAVAASAIAAVAIELRAPLVIARQDMGLQIAHDARGNWFEAYTSALDWGDKTRCVQIDRDLCDLTGRTATLMAREHIRALEEISEVEDREVVLLIGDRAWSIDALKEYYR